MSPEPFRLTGGKLLQSLLVMLYAYPAYQVVAEFAPGIVLSVRGTIATGFGMMCMVWTVQLYLWVRYGWEAATFFKFSWEK
jgi:hypothetical protein